jgi:hypothetical protein
MENNESTQPNNEIAPQALEMAPEPAQNLAQDEEEIEFTVLDTSFTFGEPRV